MLQRSSWPYVLNTLVQNQTCTLYTTRGNALTGDYTTTSTVHANALGLGENGIHAARQTYGCSHSAAHVERADLKRVFFLLPTGPTAGCRV